MERLDNAIGLAISKVNGWAKAFVLMLPNFVVAILALLLFYILSRLLARSLRRILPRFFHNDAVNRLISSLISVVTLVVGLFVALDILELEKTVTSLLAGVGIVGLALGFAFQNAAQNVLSGVVMAFNSPINVGDIIETHKHFGKVYHIGLRATRLTNPQGQEVEVPNRLVLQDPFKHYTYHGKRRVDVQGHVGLNEDLDRVEKAIMEEVRNIPHLIKDEPVQFFFREVKEFAISFELRFWVKYDDYPAYFEGHHEGIRHIRKALDKNGIRMPVPARFVQLSGEKGAGASGEGKDMSGS